MGLDGTFNPFRSTRKNTRKKKEHIIDKPIVPPLLSEFKIIYRTI